MDITAWNPLSVGLLLFVTVQRLAELVLARHNTRRLVARGAFEVAPEHYPLIVAVHTGWIGGLWLLAPSLEPNAFLVGVYGFLQAMRIWVLMTLGERWTTRIIILPNAPLVTSGPYRFVSHPNYWVVAGEILVLPLAFGLPVYALIFTLLNATALTIRIRAENQALNRPR